MDTVACSSGCVYILPWSLGKLVALLECRHCGHGGSLAPSIMLERPLEQTALSGYFVAVALKEQPPRALASHLWTPVQASANLS